MPLDYETDLAMTGALNWMYASELDPPALPYAVLYTEKRLGGDALPELRPGISIRLPFRTMEFVGSTSQVIAVHVPADGCLRVFDPAFDDALTYSVLPESITAAIHSPILAGSDVRRRIPDPFPATRSHGDFTRKLSCRRPGMGGIIAVRAAAGLSGGILSSYALH
jgi:hypothetical protein